MHQVNYANKKVKVSYFFIRIGRLTFCPLPVMRGVVYGRCKLLHSPIADNSQPPSEPLFRHS